MCSTDYNGHRTGLGVTLSLKSDPVTMFVSSQFLDVLNATDRKSDSVLGPHFRMQIDHMLLYFTPCLDVVLCDNIKECIQIKPLYL